MGFIGDIISRSIRTMTTLANGTGHSRHVNGHAEPQSTMDGPEVGPEVGPVRLGHLKVEDAPSVFFDPESGEYTIELDPDRYRRYRVDPDPAVSFDTWAIGDHVVFREARDARLTGRWFVRRLTPTGWATEAEATVPESR